MSNFNLYPHNKESYEKIKRGFKTSNIVGIVHATGTGKSFNALEYVSDNTNENILYAGTYLKNSSNIRNISDKRTLVCVPFTYPYGFATSTLMTLLSGKTAILAPKKKK